MKHNLLAEMARMGVVAKDISEALCLNEKTVRNKISGTTAFTVPEAMKIRDTFFSGMKIEYLFADTDEKEAG